MILEFTLHILHGKCKLRVQCSLIGSTSLYSEKKTNSLFGEDDGEGGRYGERNMETYITICKIDNKWELLV